VNVHLLRIATCLAGVALVATACATTPGAPGVSEPADDGAVAVTVPTEQTAPVAPTASTDRSAAGEVPGTLYGAGVSLTESIPVSELVENVDDYLGQTVRVEGLVTGVCAKRGCWMTVTDPESGKGVRIKVEDGVIVFPMEAMGHKTAAEGVFEVVGPAGEHAAAAKHAERGENAKQTEPAAAGAPHACADQEKAAAKAAATYQIAGIGAVVY